jgi:hypothetical protein
MLDLEIVAPPKVSTLGRGASFGRLLLFGDMMKTAIYVDGFNLYYRTVRGTPHKWLDLRAIFAKVLKPSHEIVLIKYFTLRRLKTLTRPSGRKPTFGLFCLTLPRSRFIMDIFSAMK